MSPTLLAHRSHLLNTVLPQYSPLICPGTRGECRNWPAPNRRPVMKHFLWWGGIVTHTGSSRCDESRASAECWDTFSSECDKHRVCWVPKPTSTEVWLQEHLPCLFKALAKVILLSVFSIYLSLHHHLSSISRPIYHQPSTYHLSSIYNLSIINLPINHQSIISKSIYLSLINLSSYHQSIYDLSNLF